MNDQPKDRWDKIDVLAKLLGAIFVPAIVAFSVYLWNVERTQRDNASSMISIAVSILNEKPTAEIGDGFLVDPLREWAVAVLETPENPPSLTQEAAAALRSGRLLSSADSGGDAVRLDPLFASRIMEKFSGIPFMFAGKLYFIEVDGLTANQFLCLNSIIEDNRQNRRMWLGIPEMHSAAQDRCGVSARIRETRIEPILDR